MDMSTQDGQRHQLPIQASVVVPTLNEAANLPRTLRTLHRFSEVIVVDSGSTDGTQSLAREAPNVRLIERDWTGYADQKNWAATQASRDWVLFLDADEWLPSETSEQIASVVASSSSTIVGYSFPRHVVFLGELIKGLGPRGGFLRLAKKDRAHFEDRPVNEHLVVQGDVKTLDQPIIHEDLRPVSDWLSRQVSYAHLEATELRIRRRTEKGVGLVGGPRNWLRERVWPRLPAKPLLSFLYFFFVKGLYKSGRQGLWYSFQQATNQVWINMISRDENSKTS